MQRLSCAFSRLKSTIYLACMKKYWKSKRGVALVHSVWNKYKNTPLFEERAKIYGGEGAAQMFSYKEFIKLARSLKRDIKFRFTLWFKPDILLRKYVNEDRYLKRFIDLSGQRYCKR